MYTTLQFLHSYWAYIVLFMVLIATLNALAGFFGGKEFQSKDQRISLFALIVTHIQFLLGIILYVISPLGIKSISNNGMATVMKDSLLRLFAVEHITVMILAVILITIGYSKHKKKQEPKSKFKTIAIFYTLAFIFMLSRIPWQQWFN